MPRMVSDEVWRQLDPYAGRLPERTTRQLWWAAAAMSLVLAAAAAVWVSGLVVPQIFASGESSSSAAAPPLDATIELRIRNHGWVSIRVTGAGLRGPGLRFDGVTGNFPHTLVPDESMTFTVRYRVTDCAAAGATS